METSSFDINSQGFILKTDTLTQKRRTSLQLFSNAEQRTNKEVCGIPQKTELFCHENYKKMFFFPTLKSEQKKEVCGNLFFRYHLTRFILKTNTYTQN